MSNFCYYKFNKNLTKSSNLLDITFSNDVASIFCCTIVIIRKIKGNQCFLIWKLDMNVTMTPK